MCVSVDSFAFCLDKIVSSENREFYIFLSDLDAFYFFFMTNCLYYIFLTIIALFLVLAMCPIFFKNQFMSLVEVCCILCVLNIHRHSTKVALFSQMKNNKVKIY